MIRLLAACLLATLLVFSLTFADTAAKTFGKAPTLTDATSIAKLNGEPQTFVEKSVLVSGKVVGVCQHRGCWVEIEDAEGARIICKSLDETILLPKDCVGQQITLQGKVVFDPKAPGTVMESHEAHEGHAAPAAAAPEAKAEVAATDKAEVKDGQAAVAPHACPAPKILIATEGATLQVAETK